MFIVEEGEIDLGHAATPELSSALAVPAMPWRWRDAASVPSRSLGERLARRLVWRGLVLVTAAGWCGCGGCGWAPRSCRPDRGRRSCGRQRRGQLLPRRCPFTASRRRARGSPRFPSAAAGGAGRLLPRPAGCRAERTARKPGTSACPGVRLRPLIRLSGGRRADPSR